MPPNNKELVTVPRTNISRNLPVRQSGYNFHEELKKTQQITDKDFYFAGGKKAPSARIWSAVGYEEGVNTKVVECYKDEEKAQATVRGWKGSEDNPDVVVERTVIHVFKILLFEAIMDAIDNGIKIKGQTIKPSFDFDQEGKPYLTDNEAQLQLMRNHLQKMKFAERDAITKARSSVIKELTGKDQRGSTNSEKEPQTQDEFLATLGAECRTCLDLSLGATPESLLVSLCGEAGISPPIKRISELKTKEEAQELLSRVRQRIISLRSEMEGKLSESEGRGDNDHREPPQGL